MTKKKKRSGPDWDT